MGDVPQRTSQGDQREVATNSESTCFARWVVYLDRERSGAYVAASKSPCEPNRTIVGVPSPLAAVRGMSPFSFSVRHDSVLFTAFQDVRGSRNESATPQCWGGPIRLMSRKGLLAGIRARNG